MNRLAELRKAAGYTQKYVALELGVKAPSVCAWEKGDGNPKQENLIALAKLYGEIGIHLIRLLSIYCQTAAR